MIKIAIIQFPGLNTEYETRREINRVGMRGEFFRWNDDPKLLSKYDGYVIGGGFSYEDRGRAGVIASLDPIMKTIKAEAEKGKPVLGICNGAQIVLEIGLIPGVDGNKLVMALARNRRIKDGKVLGTGYYNVWTSLKCTTTKDACMFTQNIKEGEILRAPIAHGEGRFSTDIPELIHKLKEKGQIVFRYCDDAGVITENFPVNPNGAAFNIAAICNPAGNVMAIMPHLERADVASEKLFSSMRDAIIETRNPCLPVGKAKSKIQKKRAHHLPIKPLHFWPLPEYKIAEKSIQMFVSLIITDNEAETYDLTIKDLGFPKVNVKRETHYEIGYKGKQPDEKYLKKLIQSGILLNTNKETSVTKLSKAMLKYDAKREKFFPTSSEAEQPTVIQLLVREKPDFVGMSKISTLNHRLKMHEITHIKAGTLWKIQIPTKSKNVAHDEFKKLANTHIFFNPHRQDAWLVA